MRSFTASNQSALAERSVIARWFFWVTVKDFDTGAPTDYGWWTGHGPVTANVKDGRTGETESRQFRGGGIFSDFSPIRLVSDLSVRSVDINLSAISTSVQNAFRGNNASQAPMQLHVGFLSSPTQGLIAAAEPMFVGFVDETPIETPAVGGSAVLTARCVSHARELMRTNTETRSHAVQKSTRDPEDFIYKNVEAVPDWTIKWGDRSKQKK